MDFELSVTVGWFSLLQMKLHACAVLGVVTLGLTMVSCNPSEQELMLVSSRTSQTLAEGEQLYQLAQRNDQQGKTDRAIKNYNVVATNYSFIANASNARYRQAELLDQQGNWSQAFDVYELFISRYPNSKHYARAVSRQSEMAQAAADGSINNRFFGLKSRIPDDKIIKMLEKIVGAAPQSEKAAKAQFSIGEIYERDKKSKEAVAAYQKLVSTQHESKYAPEALFRIGEVHLADADSGNRNQATLDLSREAFEDFVMQYPNHPRAKDAKRQIPILKGRNAKLTYDTAAFYEKTGKLESAKIYYREVTKLSASTELKAKAQARLKALGE